MNVLFFSLSSFYIFVNIFVMWTLVQIESDDDDDADDGDDESSPQFFQDRVSQLPSCGRCTAVTALPSGE